MKSRAIVNFFQTASLLMLLVAVGLLAAVTTMHFAIHGAEVQVPALKGMTVADARRETAGLGLNLDVEVHDGAVILKGKVDEEKQIQRAEKLTKSVKGVKSVKSELQIAHP